MRSNPNVPTKANINLNPYEHPYRSKKHRPIRITDSDYFGDRHSHLHPPWFNHRIDLDDPSGQNGLMAKAGAITISEDCDHLDWSLL